MKIIFVLFVVIISYFFSFNDNLCYLDDVELIERLRNIQHLDIYSIFIRKATSGLYYRPFIGLSYKLDAILFNANPFIMHVENIMYFTVVVYFFSKIYAKIFYDNKHLFYVSAFWLILNPLAVESVAWISGRSDLLSLMFLSIGFYLLFNFIETKKWYVILISFIFLLLASLTKEVSIMFFLAVPLIMTSKEVLNKFVNKKTIIVISLFPPILFASVFFILRNISYSKNNSRINETLISIFNNPEFSIMKFFRLIGFCIKKVVFPWPLNFAITGVDPLYDILGFFVVLICIYLIFKNSLINRLFVASLCFILPAYPISFGKIAWTPYAERYFFIASVFIIPFFVYYFNKIFIYFKKDVWFKYLSNVFLIVLFITVVERTYTWADNLRLFNDTVKKSPDFQRTLIILGSIYFNNGEINRAEKLYFKAKKVYSFVYDYSADYNLGIVYTKTNNFNKAKYFFEWAIKNTKSKKSKTKILNAIFEMYIKQLQIVTSENFKKVKQEYYEFYKTNKPKLNNANNFYYMGKLLLIKNFPKDAKEMFKRAYELYPDKSKYKTFSKKLYEKLSNS